MFLYTMSYRRLANELARVGGHFKNVATIDKCMGESRRQAQLFRLTGKAQTAYSRFSEAEYMKALAERFNPDSKRELYLAELYIRRGRDVKRKIAYS